VKIILSIAFAFTFIIVPFCKADENSMAVLEEINLARTNPHEYAQYILTQADARSKNDARAMQEAVNFLNRAKPLPPLTFSNGLAMGAMAHVVNQGGAGSVGHSGTDRSSPWDRMARYGRWLGTAGENISYGVSEPRQIVISLIVDSGVSNRGHRKNLFQRGFGVAGIACGSHALYGTMCVMDFAGGFVENGQVSEARKTSSTSVRMAWSGPI
jgi:uncharacterized protein YkwD